MIWSEWTIAQVALILSGISLLLSLAGFVWNVWSKFIFPKPKVRVNLSLVHCDIRNDFIVTEFAPDVFPGEWKRDDLCFPSIEMSATNFGPGSITLHSAIARKSRMKAIGLKASGMLNPYNNYPSDLSSTGPYSSGLPKLIEVGETFSAYFPVVEEWVTKENLVRFGFVDGYHRMHYNSAKNMRNLRELIFHHSQVTNGK